MNQIPAWNPEGIVPPIAPGEEGHSRRRSPYLVSPLEVVTHFAITPQRQNILKGWLQYRARLYHAGLNDGFQWVDGSFLEDAENEYGGAPGDIDIVTFFELPGGVSQAEFDGQHPDLFDPNVTRQQFRVDAYGIELGISLDNSLISDISYWYSMWSHRRHDHRWKGFLQVTLDTAADAIASKHLLLIEQGY